MLCAVNDFVKSVAPSSRVQVCKLGEDIVPSVLYMWRNVASDELKVKVCLIYFGQIDSNVKCNGLHISLFELVLYQ